MTVKKVVLITGSRPEDAPYINYYTSILQELGIEYDVIGINKNGWDTADIPANYYLYNETIGKNNSPLSKIWNLIGFYRYAKKIVVWKNYSNLFVFTLTNGLFFHQLLSDKYKKKYVFDIRDYSLVYKIFIARVFIKKVLKNSFCNCISSPGFKSWLPNDIKYILSHNIDIGRLPTIKIGPKKETPPYKILTIGQIRDELANSWIIEQLAHSSFFSNHFVGEGIALPYLKSKVVEIGATNAYFHGRYKKEEEDNIVKQYDMINIFLPDNILSNSLMSNRFYLAVAHRKPLIVNNVGIQSYFVGKYNLGLIVSEKENLSNKILDYWAKFDAEKYESGCKTFLDIVNNDMQHFQYTISLFLNK